MRHTPRTELEATQLEHWNFWLKVEKAQENACWTWLAGRTPFGYGEFQYKARKWRAHRVVWDMLFGEIPEGLIVRHTCDNPPCVNPNHLVLGTHRDNAADAVARGRMARGDNHPMRKHPEKVIRGDAHYARTNPEKLTRGDAFWSTKIPDSEVPAILARVAAGETFAAIGRDYGVWYNTISKIAKGKSRKHLFPNP